MNNLARSLFLISILLSQISCTTLTTNFHTVKEGELYRSALLNENTLKEKIRKYKIKTVLNLRGEKLGEKWYEDEKKLCETLGIKFISINFSSKPSKEYIEELLSVFDNADYPLLLHCCGGRDRAGMASTIYLVNKGESVDYAFTHLTDLKYRNLPFSNRQKQRAFFRSYHDFVQERKDINFKEWLLYYFQDQFR